MFIPACTTIIIFFLSNNVDRNKQKYPNRRWHQSACRDLLHYFQSRWLSEREVRRQSLVLQWRYNECDNVSNHLRLDCLLNRLFRCRSKKTSKLRITGLCEGNSPVTSEFPAQRASNAENVSLGWRYHCSNTRKWRGLLSILPVEKFKI